ncbi:MAG: DUF4405 domain-containing protein [Syntrophotaleaceae bacterium]
MKRTTRITIVDGIAFVSFLFLIATGLVIRYVLPPGSGGIEGYGTGWRAAARPVSVLWGLTRHEWGHLHYLVSVIFLVVIAIHLFVHRRSMTACFRRKEESQSCLPALIGIGAVIGLLALAVALVFSPAKKVPRQELRQEQMENGPSGALGRDVQ